MSALHDELSPWFGAEPAPREPEAIEPWGDLHAPAEPWKFRLEHPTASRQARPRWWRFWRLK